MKWKSIQCHEIIKSCKLLQSTKTNKIDHQNITSHNGRSYLSITGNSLTGKKVTILNLGVDREH